MSKIYDKKKKKIQDEKLHFKQNLKTSLANKNDSNSFHSLNRALAASALTDSNKYPRRTEDSERWRRRKSTSIKGEGAGWPHARLHTLLRLAFSLRPRIYRSPSLPPSLLAFSTAGFFLLSFLRTSSSFRHLVWITGWQMTAHKQGQPASASTQEREIYRRWRHRDTSILRVCVDLTRICAIA